MKLFKKLIFIFLSIGLPVYVILKERKKPVKRAYMYSVSSFTFMSMALIKQLFVIKSRLFSGDIGGIEDTIQGVIIICIILIIAVVIANLAALVISYDK